MKAYKFNYMEQEETAIIANNFTATGGFDFHIVLLSGENETIYNADSTAKCLEFMKDYKEINIFTKEDIYDVINMARNEPDMSGEDILNALN